MSKKFLVLVFLILLLSSCGSPTSETSLEADQAKEQDKQEVQPVKDQENKKEEAELSTQEESLSSNLPAEKDKTILMEEVESSHIFLYEKTAFLRIEFSVRDSTSLSSGKDIYSLSYLSSAEPRDIYEAYADYLDIVTEEWESDYSLDLKGEVKGLPISVSVEKSGLIDREGYPVRITISEEPEKFGDTNRYFDQYPNLVELYKFKEDKLYYTEEAYIESYSDGIKSYVISFVTEAEDDDFTEFYTENYGQKTDFQMEEDEYQKQFSWTDSGFEHIITFSKANDGARLEVITPLP